MSKFTKNQLNNLHENGELLDHFAKAFGYALNDQVDYYECQCDDCIVQ